MVEILVTHTLPVDIRHTFLMAALAGGLLWAIANTYAIVGAPVTPPLKVIVLCLVEAVCSIAAAGITGWTAGRGICDLLHVTDDDVVALLGLGVGLIAWVIMPKVIAVLSKNALAKLDKVDGK